MRQRKIKFAKSKTTRRAKVPTMTAKAGNDDFSEFLKQEYQTIATAHFKSIETISHFFQYYLLLLSIPISIMAFVWKAADLKDINTLLDGAGLVMGVLFLVFAVVGFGMMCYAINLRADAVLYARTVNGIRRFFYEHSKLPLDTALRLRVLPQSICFPRYFEMSFFRSEGLGATVHAAISNKAGPVFRRSISDCSLTR